MLTEQNSLELLSQQVLGRRAKRGTSEDGGLLLEGFEMVLLFDWEPAEALEDRVMCSGGWSVPLQSSECVGAFGGGGVVGRPDRMVLQRGAEFAN